jgi:serine-type D-Ala-D-Ala carboxypeptidase (penicillin-binding protein 5/6)
MQKILLALAAALLLTAAPAVAKETKPAKAKPHAEATAKPGAAESGASSEQKGGIDTAARNAFIFDYRTGAVLMDKNAEERMPPASMSKIMTAYVVFAYLKEGKASLDDMLPVSEKAWRTGGSKMFVQVGSQVRLEDLLRGMIIQSGNDACIVLAEGLAGSEEAFVDVMNKKAQELGLTGSHFANVTGLPNPEHYMTAHDLGMLAKRIISDFPEYYHYDSEKEFTYNGIKQGNRNPLLYKDIGADGMKTGHTEEAGYGLTASVVRENRRIIMVLTGLNSMKARGQESERLIEWAFREFGGYTLFKAGDKVEEADTWLGVQPKVALTLENDATVSVLRRYRKDMKVSVNYTKPIAAPIHKGQKVGKLVVTVPEMQPQEFDLVAAADVERLGALGRMGAAMSYLMFGAKN